MPVPRRSSPQNTPKYLLDRIDYELYAAMGAIGRLKESLGPDAAEFAVDVPKELKDLQYRFKTALRRFRQLTSLPASSWS
jgi:hypothetical protein